MDNINLRMNEAELDLVLFALENAMSNSSPEYSKKFKSIFDKVTELLRIHNKYKNGSVG